jgi:phosphate transport system substrate-binding protein
MLGLAVVAMCSCLWTGFASTAGAASGTLTGAGSTLVAPLMASWSQDFLNKYNIQVTYGAVGSGAGITQISARTVDFGASDAPLTSAQAASCNGCVQIPWALTATGIAFNVPGVSKLKLSPLVVANIYLGKITTWNNAAIKKLNKGVALPNLKITPIFRSDGSGDTYAFTDLLSRVSSPWRIGVGNATAVSFPTGVGGKGNDGVTALLSSTQGGIAYVAASYAIAHGLNVAALQNAAGKYEYPNLKNISAAAAVAPAPPSNLEMHIVNPPKRAKLAYPLSTYTYVIVPRSSKKLSGLASFIYYALTAGQQFGAALDFAPIPRAVYTPDLNAVKALQQG